MSRSFHTDPKWRIADRNASRDADGEVLLPRIVERAPRIGDVYPIGKAKLEWLLSRLPIELFYGIRMIELRPRQGKVGCPFASYSPASKTIRLYSLPLTVHFPFVSRRQRRLFEASKATIEREGEGYTVSWDDPFWMGCWFYYDVFLHELGHHHRMQYRSKTGGHGRRLEEEFLADVYCYWAGSGRLSPKKYERKG